MSFAERLSDLQTSNSLGRHDVFSATGISSTAYHRYVTGERQPTVSALIALSKYFKVSTDYLLGLSDNPQIVR